MTHETYTMPPDIEPNTRKWELYQVYARTKGNWAEVYRANSAFAESDQYGHLGPSTEATVNSYLTFWDKWARENQ
jgi:hypothetical protein